MSCGNSDVLHALNVSLTIRHFILGIIIKISLKLWNITLIDLIVFKQNVSVCLPIPQCGWNT